MFKKLKDLFKKKYQPLETSDIAQPTNHQTELPSQNKVYVVMTDFGGTTWAEACQKNVSLVKEITLLAQKSGEIIYFHQYIEPLEGAPVVLVECPQDFLEKIKKLPLFDKMHELQSNIRTIRSIDAPPIKPPEPPVPKNKNPKP